MPRTEALPVWQYKTRILETVAQYPVTLIAGEPGCGKTTGIPQFLLPVYAEKGRIAVTQPRRLAARSVAQYVASQLDVAIGTTVGYKIRFDAAASPDTRLVFLTEGMLLREFPQDPHLTNIAVVVLDEVHERSLDMELCLGLVKRLLDHRPDLRVVAMSATLEMRKLARFFGQPPIIEVRGRTFPVTVNYVDHLERDPIAAAIRVLRDIGNRRSSYPADDGILVFLPGEGEISEVRSRLAEQPIPKTLVLPLHATLSPEAQDRVFQLPPFGVRKIVLSTNIAETSVTVPGISVVVDTGLIRESRYDHHRNMKILELVPHSQAGCDQRMGRAGRVQPGTCTRLFPKKTFELRPRFTTPEIRREHLAHVLLAMRGLGIVDLKHFPFLDAPPPEALHDALETLRRIGALNADNTLTGIGTRMIGLPVSPRLAAVLFAAADLGCLQETLTICAGLANPPVFRTPRDQRAKAWEQHAAFHTEASDCLTLLTVYQAWVEAGNNPAWCAEHFLRADVLRDIHRTRVQLVDMLAARGRKPHQTAPGTRTAIDRALITGFGDQLWRHRDGLWYERRPSERCHIPPYSAAAKTPPDWFICAGLFRTKHPHAVGVHPVNPEEVLSLLKQRTDLTRLGGLTYDAAADAVQSTILYTSTTGSVERVTIAVSGHEATTFLASALADGRLSTKQTSKNEALLTDLKELRQRLGESLVPFIPREVIRSFYQERLGSAARLREAEECDLRFSADVLRTWLKRDLDDLRHLRDQEYPDYLTLFGRPHSLRYERGLPIISLDPELIAQLTYDVLTLPAGQMVQIDLVIRTPGGVEESRHRSASIGELQNVLAQRGHARDAQKVLQERCDRAREQTRHLRASRLLFQEVETELRSLLTEAEALAYAWKPDVAKATATLEQLEARLAQLEHGSPGQ